MKKINFFKYAATLLSMTRIGLYGSEYDDREQLLVHLINSQHLVTAVEYFSHEPKKITQLPEDNLFMIIRYLNPMEIQELAMLSKYLRNIIYNSRNIHMQRILSEPSFKDDSHTRYYRKMIKRNHYISNKRSFLSFFHNAFNSYIQNQMKPIILNSSFVFLNKFPLDTTFNWESNPELWESWKNPLAIYHYQANHKLFRKAGQSLDGALPNETSLYKRASEIDINTPFVSYVTLTAEDRRYLCQDVIEEYFAQNSHVTLLVDVSIIKDSILLIKYFKKTPVKKIVFLNIEKETSIGDYFFDLGINKRGLESVELSGLSHVTSIGDGFLLGCHDLRSVDLSPLSHVASIGDGFLLGCHGLGSINLSPLSHVTRIPNGFLFGCYGLRFVDFYHLSHVTTIGEYFLFGCYVLRSIDLSPLSHVKNIGIGFLSNCLNLRLIDFSGLINVTTIGDGFLSDCSKLERITLCHSMENGIIHRRLLQTYPRVTIDWVEE